MGVNPGPLTLRKLMWMYEGKYDIEDGNTRSMIAAVYNTVSKKLIKPSDLVSEAVNQKGTEEMTEEEQVLSLGVALGVCRVGR